MDAWKSKMREVWPKSAGAAFGGAVGALLALKFGGELCAVDWNMALELFKVLASWPPVALLIVLYLSSRFEANIRRMIDRLRGLKYRDAEATLAVEEQSLEPPKQVGLPGQTAQGPEDEAGQPPGQVPPHAQGPNRNYTAGLVNALAPGADVETAMDYVQANPGPVLDQFVMLNFRVHAERLFNIIFGTQVLATEYLAAHPTPHPLTDLLPFFNQHVELGGKADGLLGWIGFLAAQNIVKNVGTPEGPLFQVTDVGIEFMRYIKQYYPLSWNGKSL